VVLPASWASVVYPSLAHRESNAAPSLAGISSIETMQRGDALIALTDARATSSANRSSYSPASLPYIDDLIRRMDLAMSPYFY